MWGYALLIAPARRLPVFSLLLAAEHHWKYAAPLSKIGWYLSPGMFLAM